MVDSLQNTAVSKLLLIDDCPMNLDVLMTILSDRYDLRVAIDGKSALELLATSYEPDLILLDIMMPNMDGYEICRRLKQSPTTRAIPIIFLTALTSDEDEAKGLELGAVDYITKPFNPALVSRRINTQLELKQHRDHLQQLVTDQTTELRAAHNELKKIHRQMLQQEKMASVGQLAAGVAHEINNPTGFVRSNLGSLKKYIAKLNEGIDFMLSSLESCADAQLSATLKEKKRQLKFDYIRADIADLISESQDGIERIATIVGNLKSFSRSDDREQSVNVQECLESSINIAWNEIKYNATLEKNYQPLEPILCMPQQLSQVFVNLLVNAAQAIEDKGTITVNTQQDDEWTTIEICDNGSGIEPQHLDKIFQPFFTTKEVGKGTGLGLSICCDIIKKHNGTLTVDSKIGVGSCFSIKLPTHGNSS